MDVFRFSERLMSMDDAAWARHANPWSAWTRFSCGPLIVLAIWSRVWLGWWALLPLALALFWTWLNPRLFAPPAHSDHWASKGTFGERVFLNRRAVPIPAHHERVAKVLTLVSALGLLPLAYGLVVLDLPWTLLGLFVSIGAKVWFVDRMVWLYEDMKGASPDYAAWFRPPAD